LLDRCADTHGDIFTLELGALGPIVFVSDPEAVRTIFKAPSHLFECHQFNVSYEFVLGKHALFLQDGPPHKRLRRIMAPLFHREIVQGYAHDIRRVADEITEDWSSGESLRIRPLMHELALRALLSIVFGRREEAALLVKGWFQSEVWRDWRAWKPWTNLSRLRPRIRALLSRELQYRRESSDPDHPSDLLACLQSAVCEDGQPLDEDEIHDQIQTLLITAVDPVAFAMTWALSWVGRLPEVQETLRAELSGALDDPDPLTPSRLPYLTAICQETQRIHPILPTVSGRRLTGPLEIMGYRLDAGVTVAPCAYLVHRRRELYPEPHAFRPERFLSRQFGPHEYFPFGGSNRQCLGSALAPLEMKLVLATIVSRWRIAVPAEDFPADERYGTLVAPPAGLLLEIHSLLDEGQFEQPQGLWKNSVDRALATRTASPGQVAC
jgi:cytochrome P450